LVPPPGFAGAYEDELVFGVRVGGFHAGLVAERAIVSEDEVFAVVVEDGEHFLWGAGEFGFYDGRAIGDDAVGEGDVFAGISFFIEHHPVTGE